MEIIRINYNQGSPSVVHSENLQNKAHRYYFKNAITLSDNEIFRSRLDLNIENNHIEQPLKPMIRYATPVYDSKGNKRGIIILNYLAVNLLEKIQDNMILLDQDGYMLKGGSPENMWEFMYGNRQTFIKQYPAIWERINEQDSGTDYINTTLFSHTRVNPSRKNHYPAIISDILTQPAQMPGNEFKYYWNLVMLLSDPDKSSGINHLYRSFGTLFLILTLFYFVISLVAARNYLSRKQAIQNLIKREHDLSAANRELKSAISEVKKLSGMLPICASCKKIRDDQGYWKDVAGYISEHSEAEFTHGLCPLCDEKLDPRLYKKGNQEKEET